MTELSRSTAAQTDLRDVPPPRGFPRDELLRAGLMGNAIFSAGTGAAALLIPDGIAQLLGNLPPGWIQLLGASLIGFALVVGFVATRSPVPPVPAAVISLADVGWVVGSVLVIVFGAPVLGGAGVLVVGGVAVAVAGFASIQIAGLRRYARNESGRTSAVSRFDFVQRVPGDPDLVWQRLRALDRIGEFYTDLTNVRVEKSDGVVRRTCGIEGSQWSEEVLVMDDAARELVLQFDLSEGRFPVPATEMTGGWVVTETGGGSHVHLWYEYTLRGGWLGEILASLMATFYRRQLVPVVEAIGRPEERFASSGPPTSG